MLCVNRKVSLILIAIVLFFFIYTIQYPPETVSFPRFILSMLLFFNIILFIKPGDLGKIKVTKFLTRRKVITSVFMALYVILFPQLGFFVTTFIFTLGYILFFERSAAIKAFLIACGWTVVFYCAFQKLLFIWFPRGLLM